MVNIEPIFAGVGIIILLGFLTDLIFSKTEIPDVIWLILVGILIGPVFQFIKPNEIQETATVFTSFALLFILFEGGLHIRIKDLMKSMYGATTITLVNFILTVVIITTIAKFAGLGWEVSILLGTILGGTSSAVVVPIVRKLSMGGGNSLVLILESAFSDVLCIVASLSIIEILTVVEPDFGTVLQSLFGNFAIAIFIGSLAGFLWILLMEKFTGLSQSYISTIGVLMLIFSLTEFANSSGAIAGLTFGIVVGNSRKILSMAESEATDTLSVSARAFFSQISFFVKTFFFVYIGLLVAITDYFPILLGFLISVAIFLIRPFSVKIGFMPGERRRDKAVMESMVPKGLAAAVLAQIPLQDKYIKGYLDGTPIYSIPGAEQILTPVISTIFFTIVITTIMVFLSEKTRYPGTSGFILRMFGKKPNQQKTQNSPGVNVMENSGQSQVNESGKSPPNQKKEQRNLDQRQPDITIKSAVTQHESKSGLKQRSVKLKVRKPRKSNHGR